MTGFLLIVLAILLIVLNVITLYFSFKILKRNDSINKIHYLISDNNMRINDVYNIIIKYRELIDEEVENIKK